MARLGGKGAEMPKMQRRWAVVVARERRRAACMPSTHIPLQFQRAHELRQRIVAVGFRYRTRIFLQFFFQTPPESY